MIKDIVREGETSESADTVLDSACLDRRIFDVVDLSRSGHDVPFWLTRTGAERLFALELLRRVCYGYDEIAEGLQRVLVVAERDGG
ncbi:MAG TPA: hypothetical protein PKN61_06300 [Acidobacteriota bacterium]|jgi:transcription termination factor Rho|nr:hypothetical protein [Acidobacteriota bacterium]HNR38627.1 hypothetical protein [Acidobacteriota bacterium]HNU01175.1 hypothetical protein [Acidobacteriota bacterium]HPB28039.1 hypothetical protein [Acidobacteriota bacterium]HQO25260.1 hypothetical protein [Acidobacteriota bacterium]